MFLALLKLQKNNKAPTIAPHWVTIWAFARMIGVLYIAVKFLDFDRFDTTIITIVIADVVWSFLGAIFDMHANHDVQRRGIFRAGQRIGSLIFAAVYFGYYYFG